MKPLTLISLIAVLSIALFSCSNLKKNRENAITKELEPFPEARKGFIRFVIILEQKESDDIEKSYQVEIIPGKTLQVDCNHHSLLGNIIEKDIEGWGYTYFEFNSDGQIISTKMACPDYILSDKFIAGETKMIRYNSKLPVIVYVPKGFEVKYKIWQGNELQPAQLK
jgi:ecotin